MESTAILKIICLICSVYKTNKKVANIHISFICCFEFLMKLIPKGKYLPSWNSGKSHETIMKSSHTSL